jgi:Na+-transporting NADH:ubiquinone oxidoreductase subunit D
MRFQGMDWSLLTSRVEDFDIANMKQEEIVNLGFKDLVLKAFAYELSKTLSVFVGLIITNCIIMGRFEAFALANGPWRSFLDGIGNAVGYGVILIAVGFFRELLGSGTLLGFAVLGDPIEKTGLYAIGYENNGFMLLSPMALIVVGILIWIQRSRNTSLIEEN